MTDPAPSLEDLVVSLTASVKVQTELVVSLTDTQMVLTELVLRLQRAMFVLATDETLSASTRAGITSALEGSDA